VDRFSKEGWNVILIDLNKDKGEAKASSNTKLQFLLGDVTNKETWEKALNLAQNDYGRVDVVVNNAGTSTRDIAYHSECSLIARNDTTATRMIFSHPLHFAYAMPTHETAFA
jgi:NADP-dependent 3-hydroxy acid dehydrogenase YdfG